MALTHIQKQRLFPGLVAQLIQWAHANGYELTFGEAWRPDAVAAEYAKPGGVVGISNSLHRIRLAVDFNVFSQGVWLKKTEELEPLGLFWESLTTPEYTCSWGGRFQDGNHFSISHNGVR